MGATRCGLPHFRERRRGWLPRDREAGALSTVMFLAASFPGPSEAQMQTLVRRYHPGCQVGVATPLGEFEGRFAGQEERTTRMLALLLRMAERLDGSVPG